MSLDHFLLGAASLVATVIPVALGARRLRRRALPAWSGPPAWLADSVLALALLFVTALALGTVGLFRRGALVTGAAAAGLAAAAWARRLPPVGKDAALEGRATPVPPTGRLASVGALAVVALVTAQWAVRTADAVAGGITEPDSIHYHLSFAARFAQEGWTSRLHVTMPEFPISFFPANGELLQGMGMALLGRDVLSPLLNMAWMALALLAAWCIGRPFGQSPAAVTVLGVLLSTPVVVSQAGTAHTDVAGLALLLAAAALLLQPGGQRAALVLAGATAGLALGTKLTLVAPVAALTVGVVAMAARGRRLVTALAWSAPLLVTGSYWYLRNLVRTGTPLPGVHLGIGPIAFPQPRFALTDQLSRPVVHYVTDGDVWHQWFLPGLSIAFGRAWWLVLSLAGAGVVVAVGRRRPRVVRMLGVVAGLSVLAYTATPGSALGSEGVPVHFVSNLRYLTPPLALALVVLPVAVARWHRSKLASTAISLAGPVALLAIYTSREKPAWPGGHRATALAAGLAVVVGAAAVLALRGRRLPRVVVAGILVAMTLAGLAAGDAVQRRYLRGRYATVAQARWADGKHEQRVAVTRFAGQYQLYGSDLSNHVQYVGRRGPHGEFYDAAGCDEWRRLLHEGGYRWVALVVGTREEGWAMSDPAATEVLRRDHTAVYRLDGRRPAGPCPR